MLPVRKIRANFDTASLILNPYRPDDVYSRSDFDMHHMVNANWMWALPFGRGKSYLADISGLADAIIGGWQLHGIFRFNSGMPEWSVYDSGRWVTNWNISSSAVRIRNPGANPHKGGDSPNFWSDPQYAYNSYRNPYAGESGDRNVLNMSEYMTVDFGLSKVFKMPVEGHRIQFRWEVFNALNQQYLGHISSYGVYTDPQLGTAPSSFGNITASRAAPGLCNSHSGTTSKPGSATLTKKAAEIRGLFLRWHKLPSAFSRCLASHEFKAEESRGKYLQGCAQSVPGSEN